MTSLSYKFLKNKTTGCLKTSLVPRSARVLTSARSEKVWAKSESIRANWICDVESISLQDSLNDFFIQLFIQRDREALHFHLYSSYGRSSTVTNHSVSSGTVYNFFCQISNVWIDTMEPAQPKVSDPVYP